MNAAVQQQLTNLLRANSMTPDTLDGSTLTQLFLSQMRISLYGGVASIPPPFGTLTENKPIAVAELDDQEIRVSLVTFSHGEAHFSDQDRFPIPGREYPAPWEDLIYAIGELTQPLLDRAQGLALCLPFSVVYDGKGDGTISRFPGSMTIHGFSVHPGTAKDTMINASNVAMEFHQALPITARPETTEGRQGFYHLCQMYGDVTNAKLGYILRDHDADKLQYKKDNLLHIADYLNGKYGPGTVEVEIKDSYRNMLEKIKPHFHLVENARRAIEKAGLTPEEVPVRGGTDGATLSWKGLPCPNLGTGAQ